MQRETVRPMTQGQWKDIIATMVGTVPGLSQTEAQFVIGMKRKFVEGIRDVFGELLDLSRLTYIVQVVPDIEYAIEIGDYSSVNELIDSAHFPVKPPEDHTVAVELFRFYRWIKSEAVLEELGKAGYRPARLEELLALGAAYPDLQREFPIVALGSTIKQGLFSDANVPGLSGDEYTRKLELDWFATTWGPRCGFAAIRV